MLVTLNCLSFVHLRAGVSLSPLPTTEATFAIEINDKRRREQMLRKLVGIEDQLYLQFGAHKVFARPVVPESVMHRTDRTSSLHFLRFRFSEAERNGG